MISNSIRADLYTQLSIKYGYIYEFDRHVATIKEHHNYVEIKFHTTTNIKRIM